MPYLFSWILIPLTASNFLLGSVQADSITCSVQNSYALVVHGGYVGYEEETTAAHLELVETVVADGRQRLADGARALDVVVEMIAVKVGAKLD